MDDIKVYKSTNMDSNDVIKNTSDKDILVWKHHHLIG
jgi:sporulation-control protein spo0M